MRYKAQSPKDDGWGSLGQVFRFTQQEANVFMKTWWRVKGESGATMCYVLEEEVAKEIATFLNGRERCGGQS